MLLWNVYWLTILIIKSYSNWTKYALDDIFLYSYEAESESTQSLNGKDTAYFLRLWLENYVDQIYPIEFEIKDTMASNTSDTALNNNLTN